MSSNASIEAICTLLERWAGAGRGHDLDGVVAGRAADVVRYDVPPPAVRRVACWTTGHGPDA